MAILGLLKRQPMHGYDLRKRLRNDFGLLSSLSFGSLYPALARLEHDGAVREVAGAPPTPSAEVVAFTGSLAGERAAFRARLAARSNPASARATRAVTSSRTRKVYELTPSGEQLFERLLTDDGADDKDGKTFALRWAFARHLTPDARMRLLERRKRQLEERRSLACRVADSPPRPLDRFERSLVEHSSAAVQFEFDWIERLIAAERAARPDSSGESRREPAAEVS
ncbi:MAG: PadR family transcriptional regulator [Acidimicrobiales bacterium]|jgi:DNA-binding PadR family transcriptional regulator